MQLLNVIIGILEKVIGLFLSGKKYGLEDKKQPFIPDRVIEKYLTLNSFSRPGKKLGKVKGIVVHWVANPGSTALDNWRFFELRAKGGHGFGSAHYIIDDETTLLCIPEDELAYHVGAKTYMLGITRSLGEYPNANTIGIECCHPDWSGKPTAEVRRRLVNSLAKLCIKYHLTSDDIYLHRDITGKECHRYYVRNPNEWAKVKRDVRELL